MILEDLHTGLEELCTEEDFAGISIGKVQGERWMVSVLSTDESMKHMGLGDGDTMAEAIEQAIADYRREDV